MQKRKLFLLSALSIVMSTTAFASEGAYPTDSASLAIGQALAENNCAACHAVGKGDASAKAGAPAFRELSHLYPLESLEESLAEGIVTAHENMPEIVFEPDEIDAFLGYLTSIQTK